MSTRPSWGGGVDPWLSTKMRRTALVGRVENDIYAALIDAMAEYLDEARINLLGITASGALTASMNLGMWPDASRWSDLLGKRVIPRLLKSWGEEFIANARAGVGSALRYREKYLQEVWDRLSPAKWAKGVFETVRAELAEAMDQGESIQNMTQRLGDLLNINAWSRKIRARAAELRKVRDDDTSTPAQVQAARAELKGLYAQLGDADRQWQPDARRIARTETIGALNGGSYAGALAWAEESGQKTIKQWLSTTTDDRTRDTHVEAHGQRAALREPFLVGGFHLQFPGDPTGPAAEVIQCRCTALYMDENDPALSG